MSEFMTGLKQRNRSRLEVLEKMKNKEQKQNEREQ